VGVALPPEIARLLEAADEAAREQAWDDFVSAFSRLLLHTARSVAHDHDAAMDAYVKVLEELRADGFRRLRGYEAVTHAKFTTWLVVVVRRLCLDHRRQRYGRTQSANPDASAARRRLAELVGEDVDAAQIADTADGPASVLEKKERSHLLESCRDELDPRDQLLLKLRFEDEQPVRAIAELMGYRTVFHAYRRLEAVLADDRELAGRTRQMGGQEAGDVVHVRILKLHLRKLKHVFDARVLAARLLDSYGSAPPVRAPLGQASTGDSSVPSFSSTSRVAGAGNRQMNRARRARQSRLFTWSESTAPDTSSPGGSRTSNG